MADELATLDLERLAAGLEAIIDAAADVLAASSLETTLHRMADALGEIVAYTSLAIYEVDEAAAQLVPMFCVGSYVEETLRDRPPLDGSISGRAVRECRVVISGPGDDLAETHITPGTPAEEDEALVSAPLHVGGRPIGTLNVWRERVNPTFSAAEVRLVRHFATLAAMAYVNARQADVLREQARRDPLTGVFNRRHFERELVGAVADIGLGGVVVLFDVDEFKPINDRYGHPEGDRVLKALAAALADCAGRAGGAVFRVGGDEFAVLLPGMGRERAGGWLQEAAAAVGSITPGGEGRLRASAGTALLRRDDTIESVVRRADEALLDAKRR